LDNETPSFEELMDKALRLFEISAVRDPETAQLGMLITERPGVPYLTSIVLFGSITRSNSLSLFRIAFRSGFASLNP